VTITLLLDMDGTLLDNSVRTFVPAYMEAVARHLAARVGLEQLNEALLTSTRQMILNQNPDCTLLDVFECNFYPRVGIPRDELAPLLVEFFANVYPDLKHLTERRPEAIEFVQQALKREYRVAVATNPLFPLTAIEQRLEWAGLSPREYPFAVVPGAENVHFAKPNPAFLAELLAVMGWPEGPAIMVGDDLENDILCAQALGLATYAVDTHNHDHDSDHDGNAHPYKTPQGSGILGDLLGWIDSIPTDELKADMSSSSALLAVLRSTPAALNTLCKQIVSGTWNQRPRPDEWSPAEIFCHLRDVEQEVNLPRLNKVLVESNPFIPGQDTDAWAQQRSYLDQNGELALNSFVSSRIQLIKMISQMDGSDWQRPARHAIFGPTILQELVRIITGHDRLHIRQLYSIIHPPAADSPAG
jgi:FMN phosphatase YigB (HAD superfamily)